MKDILKMHVSNKELKPPKKVIFDWDGTIVDTSLTIKHAFKKMLAQMGVSEVGSDLLRGLGTRSVREMFPELFGDDSEKAQNIFYDNVKKNHLDDLDFMPGAHGLLMELKNKGISMSVISNKRSDFLHKEIGYLKLTPFFSKIIGSGDCEEDKPSAVPVKSVLDPQNYESLSQVWFVGDTIIDLECAWAAGCTPILVYGADKKQDWKTIKPYFSFESCQDLKNIIDSIN